VRKAYLWTTALAVAAGITLTLTYSGLRPGLADADPFTLTPGANSALLLGLLAVAVLAYAMFVVARPRPLRGSRWRYALVPLALVAASAACLYILLPLVTGLAADPLNSGRPDYYPVPGADYLPLTRAVHLSRNHNLPRIVDRALPFGPAAFAVPASALFVVVKSRPLGVTRWRYVLGVPFALLAVLAVLYAAMLPLTRGSY